MSLTVAELLIDTLERIGVQHIFGLIGDSLNPIADAVRRTKIEWVGVRHEEGAALAAAGQAKLTGKLGVCCGTTGPGSTHLVAGLYEASRDHAPVLAVSGQMPRKLLGQEYFQATDPALLFRDLALYTETITSPAQAPAVIHQAIGAAYAGRGVAHLTLPSDVLLATTESHVASLATLRPLPEIAPTDDTAIDDAVQRINASERIVIMCGAGCRGATEELRAFSDRLKAPLIHSVKGQDLMAYDDPHWVGGIGMIGTKPVYQAATHCDLFLMLGTDYPYSAFLPHDTTVVQIDDRATVLGRRVPTKLGIVSSIRPALKLLIDRVAAKSDDSFLREVNAARRQWDVLLDKQADPARNQERIYPQAVARTISDLANRDAVFVIDTGLNTLWSANWLRQSGSQRIIGSFNNGAVGTALGQANGIQAVDRSRQVIALCGDGGFNMLMSEFLTAAHHRLPVKVVVYNNESFGLITLEAESLGLPPYKKGIVFPNPDYVALARACGGYGFRAAKPADVAVAIKQALEVDGPAIVDCVVDPNELPNFPHLELDQVGRYAAAKVKEALNAFVGR